MRTNKRDVGVRWIAAMVSLGVIASSGMARGAGGSPVMPLDVAAARLGLDAEIPELAAGRATARQLDTDNDSELCATGAVIVDVPLDFVVEGFRSLSLLRDGGTTVTAGRITNEATITDFDALDIPQADLGYLQKARPNQSEVKLSSAEIAAIQAGRPDRTVEAFKASLRERVLAWRANGLEGLGAYNDKKQPVSQSRVASALLASLATNRPTEALPLDEKFQFWSVERFGSLKPLVALTNMAIYRRPGAARIETVQLYASHYCEGLVTSIDLLSLPASVGESTLVRLTFRSQVDSLGGMLGGLKRKVGRSKMVTQLVTGLEGLKASAVRAHLSHGGPALASAAAR